MKKFQYLVQSWSGFAVTDQIIETHLNNLGDQGWELVAVTECNDQGTPVVTAYFKAVFEQ
jgi:hypothetical protein